MSGLRAIPAVDRMLQDPQVVDLIHTSGRPLVLKAIRQVLTEARERIKDQPDEVRQEDLVVDIEKTISGWLKPTLQPVINATGVILHTNLGRAPLSVAAIEAVVMASAGYSTLEFDLETGKRGSRSVHIESVLKNITGAEAGLVVNNNAAAVLLVLSALSRRKRAVIARSQLVEIGGGFRVPEVMAQSGAKLVEIGTTNRVHIDDFKLALEEPTAIVMRVHPSNFKIVGFTFEPEFSEIVTAAHHAGAIVVDDLGSGALVDTAKYGLAQEPTVFESLSAGADVVCFSGDKLLGGPQAGIILGKKSLLDKIKRDPLARAVRADKVTLAALTATLYHYLKDEVETQIPVWQMISQPLAQIRQRAEKWRLTLGAGVVQEAESTIGGGSLPGEVLPTFVLAVEVKNPNQIMARLRESRPAVIARVENNKILFDPRTVLLNDEENFLGVIDQVIRRSLKKR